MCGILIIVDGAAISGLADLTQVGTEDCAKGQTVSPSIEDFRPLLQSRGPDGHHLAGINLGHGARIHCLATVLQLRGSRPVSAGHSTDGCNDLLLFNGEVFSGLPMGPHENDAEALAAALAGVKHEDQVLQLLQWLRGPWALAYWRASSRTLFFGRDVLGRRSLLVHFPDAADGRLLLASVAHTPGGDAAHGGYWQELPPGLRSIVFGAAPSAIGASNSSRLWGHLRRHPWTDPELQQLATCERAPHLVPQSGPSASAQGPTASTAAGAGTPPIGGAASPPAADIGCRAQQLSLPTGSSAAAEPAACEGGSCDVPSAGSGDALARAAASLLAVLAQAVRTRCLEADDVASDRRAAELAGWHPASQLLPAGDGAEPLQPEETAGPGADGNKAVALRPAPVLLLFSGGVDSTLLAALAHRALPPAAPIDLATVCFAGGTSPDRVAARDALEELAAFAPQREWRLIEVDATLEAADAHRNRLLHLLHPAATVMDLNIGTALWTAAAGVGILRFPRRPARQIQPLDQLSHAGGSTCGSRSARSCTEGAGALGSLPPSPSKQPQDASAEQQAARGQPQQHEGSSFCSAARVVLLGHGADEQCGGYGRHRTTFRRADWAGLAEELGAETARMWLRNLGRDDRLVADRGREARHPFLAEEVVAHVLSTPLHLVCDLRLAPGVGDKAILREALRQLGLPRAAARVKRAIQFGSRIGSQANRRDFGSNRAANLANAGSVRLADVPAARCVGGNNT